MILVTGATGFLGGHLVRLLLDQGESVRVLCRQLPRETLFNPAEVNVVLGDITKPETLPPAVREVKHVYHVAGRVDFNPRDDRELRAVNVEGTRSLLTAARAAQVERVVHVSSVSTIGAATAFEHPLNEQDFGQGLGLDIPYPRSKHAGEQVALEFAASGFPVVIANPTFFAGPGDLNFSSARTIISFLRRQVWVGLDRGGMGYTDVRDVAAGLIAAMRQGRPGERYILGGTNLRLVEYHGLLAKLTGLQAPRIRVSPPVAKLLAHLGQVAYGLVGVKTFVGAGDVRLAQHYWVYDYSKSCQELGLTCRSPEESLTDALAWLREKGIYSPRGMACPPLLAL